MALAAVNYRGVTRTARLTRVIVAVVLLALALTAWLPPPPRSPPLWRRAAGTGPRPWCGSVAPLPRWVPCSPSSPVSAAPAWPWPASVTAGHRRFPRALQVLGAAGCVALVATLPVSAVLSGLGVVAVGAGYRVVRLRNERRS